MMEHKEITFCPVLVVVAAPKTVETIWLSAMAAPTILPQNTEGGKTQNVCDIQYFLSGQLIK